MDESVATLLALMPPLGGSPEPIDWHPVDTTTGRYLPGDFRDFMDHFGPGSIDRFLVILVPDQMDPGRPSGRMSEETLNARGNWDEEGGPEGLGDEDRQSLVAWGVDGFANIYCWLTSDDDLSTWPVVVWRENDVQWSVYEVGMAEFLLKVLNAQLSDDCLDGLPIWGKTTARFISHKERLRLRGLGINAWTGEVRSS
ncbi:SMI1/KNR4 family protein [Yinghuangia soli]|uniref:SMI1/KNR4 family protein n=1 Tax=Yinghuangia soli TaxID=2908204 RepID=A0AA41PVN6_9ACTN|nr:SMI1/KNR4 family protein [Yinghuangia soli]MCF2525744.1 SMI1/KNR4 family protein [Yinghuangia soli]